MSILKLLRLKIFFVTSIVEHSKFSNILRYIMSSIEESARLAMRQLWEASDTCLRETVERDAIDQSGILVEIETPNGLEIRRIGGSILEVGADFKELFEGVPTEVSYRVEWSGDREELPRVYRDVWSGNQSRPITVAQREFPIIAQHLGALVT
jgi:hypothetical protein